MQKHTGLQGCNSRHLATRGLGCRPAGSAARRDTAGVIDAGGDHAVKDVKTGSAFYSKSYCLCLDAISISVTTEEYFFFVALR
ncbi:unnamed protein product [Urochloa humidicola]